MTLISPVPRRWARWLKFIWWVTRRRLRHNPGTYPFGRLQRLSFIHFAHWSLFDRIPPNGPNAKKLPHPYLIFQTNFDRGWREYVEAFCFVMPFAMRVNWSGLRAPRSLGMRAYGFPPPQPVEPFLDYVDPRFTHQQHFYCAYPNCSTREVIAQVDARKAFGRFAGEASHAPKRFVGPASGPKPLGGPREKTDTLSVLAPLLPGRAPNVERILKGLPTGMHSPLAGVPATHMARWSIVKPLPYKNRPNRTVDSNSYLLFTSWFDGDTSGYINALSTNLNEVADKIWGNCVAYPGYDNRQEFWTYMTEHSIHPRLAFAGYHQTVTEVRAAIELHDLLEEPVADLAMLDTATLEKLWRKRWGGGDVE